MKFRRAQSIYTYIQNEEICVQNFLRSKTISITLQELSLILAMEKWVDVEYLTNILKGESTEEEIVNSIYKLILCGIILSEGTPEEDEDVKYQQNWDWGTKAGAYHFAIKNTQFLSPNSDEMKVFSDQIEQKTIENPSPVLFSVNKNKYDKVHYYSVPAFDNGIFKTIKRRRTVRNFDLEKPVSQTELTNCLYAGLGISKFKKIPPMGEMPFKMTPSGGARNPFDAFIQCRNVTGLPGGLYHYSAIEHSLGLVNGQSAHSPGSILANQLWIDDAAVVVFLVANFERTMWKYSHPVGYKAVLVEAGHIAQNIILAANELGFYGSPTAAIMSSKFEEIMLEKSINQSCVYAIALGYAQENAEELV